MHRLLTAALATFLVYVPVSAKALDYRDLTASEQNFVRDYVVSNALWALLHEAGHMLISRLELPVLGREEDAADSFATVVMLEAKDPRMDEALRSVSKDWLNPAQKRYETDNRKLADLHGLPRQRGFATLCMMLDSDSTKFFETASALAYPPDAPTNCYASARSAWGKLLSPHLREDGSSRVAITYEEGFGTEDEGYVRVKKWLKEARTNEVVAEMLGRYFDFGGTVQFSAAYCSDDDSRDSNAQNAFWKKRESQIVFCYELAIETMDHAIDEVAKNRKSLAAQATINTSRGKF